MGDILCLLEAEVDWTPCACGTETRGAIGAAVTAGASTPASGSPMIPLSLYRYNYYRYIRTVSEKLKESILHKHITYC